MGGVSICAEPACTEGKRAMTVDQIQQAYKEAGHHTPSKKRAGDILAALPFMAVSTAMSEADVLEVCVVNHANGATRRLVIAHKDFLRDGGVQ